MLVKDDAAAAEDVAATAAAFARRRQRNFHSQQQKAAAAAEAAAASAKSKKKAGGSQWSVSNTSSVLKFLRVRVKHLFHVPMSILNKSSCILPDATLADVLPVSWELLR